ncbi:hypothetical protein [Rossellomorea vietnamensis]|uniref:hypothetical protein n=1 Tax=Rossellomorea vietnamensis TaxID=218284 RepID=UPI001E5DA23C|nr:hypothetical protein [Rossellomorea vietnamensis]MCC5803892.1 hypothetical protein [Rossellomorea vietnamensis]
MRENQDKQEIKESLNDLYRDNPFSDDTKQRWLMEIEQEGRRRRTMSLFPRVLSIGVAVIFFIGFGWFLLQQVGVEGDNASDHPPTEEGKKNLPAEKDDLQEKVLELKRQEEVDMKEFLTYFHGEVNKGYTSYPPDQHDGYYYQSKEEVLEGVLSVLGKAYTTDSKLKRDLSHLEELCEEFLYVSRKFPPEQERSDPAKVYYYTVGLIDDLYSVLVLGETKVLNGYSEVGNGDQVDVIEAVANRSGMYPDSDKPLVNEGKKPLQSTDDGYPPIEAFQIEKTEFTDLSTFVHDTYDSYQDGSEYKEGTDNDAAESALIRGAIAYINYFEKDIEEKEMTEDFEEWQVIAYEFNKGEASREVDASKQAELKKRFEEKMGEVVEKF